MIERVDNKVDSSNMLDHKNSDIQQIEMPDHKVSKLDNKVNMPK